MSDLNRSVEQVLAIRTNAYLMAIVALLILSAPIFMHHKAASTVKGHLAPGVALSR